jgi:hypothetical protein
MTEDMQQVSLSWTWEGLRIHTGPAGEKWEVGGKEVVLMVEKQKVDCKTMLSMVKKKRPDPMWESRGGHGSLHLMTIVLHSVVTGYLLLTSSPEGGWRQKWALAAILASQLVNTGLYLTLFYFLFQP